MTSFGNWLWAGSLTLAACCAPALSTSPAHAAAPHAVRASTRTADAIPPQSVTRVRDEVARVWGVPDGSVELSFGRCLDDPSLVTSAPVRLTGRGIDGWFVALFDVPGRSPVALRVRAGMRDIVCVAARPLANGAHLVGADMRDEVRVHWGAPKARDIAPGVGWEVRRSVAAGDELTPSVVVAPHVIESGAPVTVVWRTGAVSVTQSAIALTSAHWGETVRVRLDGRGDRVTGRAVDRGVVAIGEGMVR